MEQNLIPTEVQAARRGPGCYGPARVGAWLVMLVLALAGGSRLFAQLDTGSRLRNHS
jgi:hypothetical protein